VKKKYLIGQSLPNRKFVATNVSLFLYNAAVWNAHRIHYDENYTKEVEKHPGIVIDGPLQGDWLTQVAMDWIGEDGILREFEYTNRIGSYVGETLIGGGEITESSENYVRVSLFLKNLKGQITTPGSALLRLI